MTYLLDTCSLLWLLTEPERIPRGTLDVLRTAESVRVSHISIWECQIKFQRGKLELPMDPADFFKEALAGSALEERPLMLDDIFMLSRLPNHHGDPFDRLLIAQALASSWPLVTNDSEIRRYPVKTMWG